MGSCKGLVLSLSKAYRLLICSMLYRYLIMEYVDGGELIKYIVESEGLEEWEVVRFFRQMMAGLTYCHEFSICHRDLKLENILLDRDRNLKIADFGFAALQPHDRLLQTPCGSPHYVAPEIAKVQRYRGDIADIWSCGVILYALLTGTHPFDDDDLRLLLAKVKRGKFSIPAGVSAEATDLLHRMLQVDPRRRISMAEIWQHSFVGKHNWVFREDGSVEHFAIPPSFPAVMQFAGPTSRTEIDREILRNLHSLWHNEKEDMIVRRLLNDE